MFLFGFSVSTFSLFLLPLLSPKDLTALGGKVGRAGPGVEAEEGEGVEVGAEGVKLLTLGVGETDQDAVLQAGKAQVDSIEIASQQLVLEMLNIVGGLGGGGVEAPRLGLVEEVIDEMNELAAGLGNFRDHMWRFLYRDSVKDRALDLRRAAVDGTISITALARKGPPRGDARGDGFGGKDVRRISSGVGPRMAVAVSCGVGLGREGRGKHREVCVYGQERRKASDNGALGRSRR